MFESINFTTKNDFSFILDKKYKIKNLKITSKVNLHELSAKNNFDIKSILPDLSKNILLKNHLINIIYEKDKFDISGKGSALFQKEESNIHYIYKKNKQVINFKGNLDIAKNPFKLNI